MTHWIFNIYYILFGKSPDDRSERDVLERICILHWKFPFFYLTTYCSKILISTWLKWNYDKEQLIVIIYLYHIHSTQENIIYIFLRLSGDIYKKNWMRWGQNLQPVCSTHPGELIFASKDSSFPEEIGNPYKSFCFNLKNPFIQISRRGYNPFDSIIFIKFVSFFG